MAWGHFCWIWDRDLRRAASGHVSWSRPLAALPRKPPPRPERLAAQPADLRVSAPLPVARHLLDVGPREPATRTSAPDEHVRLACLGRSDRRIWCELGGAGASPSSSHRDPCCRGFSIQEWLAVPRATAWATWARAHQGACPCSWHRSLVHVSDGPSHRSALSPVACDQPYTSPVALSPAACASYLVPSRRRRPYDGDRSNRSRASPSCLRDAPAPEADRRGASLAQGGWPHARVRP